MAKKPTSRKKVKTVKRRTVKPKSQQPQPTSSVAPKPGVYRPTSMYGVLFTEGSRDYVSKDELLKKVAVKTGKPIRSVEFAYQVLKSKGHKSNGGRSCELQEGDKVKLIAIRNPH